MTRAFSTKRRKIPGSQTRLAQGLRSIKPLGVSSVHAGSKPSYVHLTRTGPLERFEAAQAWHKAAGKPLPPHLRPRSPLAPPAALDVRGRFTAYCGIRTGRGTTGDLLDSPRLTPAQRKRLLHKAGQHGERPHGFKPERPAPGPRRRLSVAALRRARRNAAQKARHENRRPSDGPAA